MKNLPSFMQTHGQALIAHGYRPIPIRPGVKSPGSYSGGQWHDLARWQQYGERQPTPFEMSAWQRWPGCAVGIACGNIAGLDIDVMDEALACQIEALAFDMLGATPAIRIGQAPKRMLVYATAEPFRGRKRKPIELYAIGSQFVAYAIHPVTGQPYAWPDQSLDAIPISALPVVTEAQAVAWLDAAYDLIQIGRAHV